MKVQLYESNDIKMNISTVLVIVEHGFICDTAQTLLALPKDEFLEK